MNFKPLNNDEQSQLRQALAANADGVGRDRVAGGIRINPDTSFGGSISPEDVLAATEQAGTDAMINAICSVPTHYIGDAEAAIMRGLTLPAPLVGELSAANYASAVARTPGANLPSIHVQPCGVCGKRMMDHMAEDLDECAKRA